MGVSQEAHLRLFGFRSRVAGSSRLSVCAETRSWYFSFRAGWKQGWRPEQQQQ